MENYELFQNYPNPFNPVTKIKFSVPENGSNVKLAVFNTKGEQVVTLIDGAFKAGMHSATFNAENLNSGVYYYRLSVDGAVKAVRRMVMVK